MAEDNCLFFFGRRFSSGIACSTWHVACLHKLPSKKIGSNIKQRII
jgi:hypothetical protein